MNRTAPVTPTVAQSLAMLGAPVVRITSDSRAIRPGDTFAAYPGEARDGRSYIGDALSRGAGSVFWEANGFAWRDEWQTPNLGIPNLREELGWLADAVYGHPSERLWMIGVTGTNGKTSSTHWIAQALNGVGRRSATVGTLGNGFAGALEPAVNTTPDAAALHEMLRKWVDAGAQAVAMEVSSHGLAQGRANGVRFDVALFTNLTRDHLDYHGTFEAYAAAKARLFEWPTLSCAVINADDPFGEQLIERCRKRGLPTLAYGIDDGDVHATRVDVGIDGISATVETPLGVTEIRSEIVGAFNVSNLLGALGVLIASGVPLEDAGRQLSEVTAVPGRMERTGGAGKPLVVVDYAHTPDALQKALIALRPVADANSGRLIALFGCGGDRDPGKRPQMGSIAARYADVVVVTSDNPRSESPQSIVDEIVAGVDRSASLEAIVDRGAAIAATVAGAASNDVVLIAGKGHEPYQEVGGVRYPFSDMAEANRALAQWRPR